MPRCARRAAAGTSTRTTATTAASTSATSRATSTRTRPTQIVQREPIGESAASQAFSAGAVAGPEIQLRTYRLALITDPSYATYHGVANVTAAKVTLMNRVNQIYETESAIRMVLIADNDKLNLNTTALATGANGPCGAAALLHGDELVRQRARPQPDTWSARSSARATTTSATSRWATRAAASPASASSASATKARGCTGLATPIGDFFAVDYVAHEMGHQFAGNHTFNGTLVNCGGNRSGQTSVEPGSGSSVMAYAGICGQDNLQPHSDPYWVPKSYEEILAHVTGDRNPINEVQNVSFRDFDGTDSFTLSWDGRTTAPIVRGTNFTAAAVQTAIQGPSEVQTVALTGYDANGDSYRLSYGGANSHPIVRGQNNTAAGIPNALVGGNEQQQVVLTGFNATTQSFQIQVNGVNSVTLGQGGLAVNNGNVAAAVNGIAGLRRHASASSGAGNGGFTLTFAGASAEHRRAVGLDRQLHRARAPPPCARRQGRHRRCPRGRRARRSPRRHRHRRRLHADDQRRRPGHGLRRRSRSPTSAAPRAP